VLKRARIDAQRAREEERLRVEEEARMGIEEREKALKLATVEEVWERESACSSHRSFPTESKRNCEYVCFDRSRCGEKQLQPERRFIASKYV